MLFWVYSWAVATDSSTIARICSIKSQSRVIVRSRVRDDHPADASSRSLPVYQAFRLLVSPLLLSTSDNRQPLHAFQFRLSTSVVRDLMIGLGDTDSQSQFDRPFPGRGSIRRLLALRLKFPFQQLVFR